MKCDKHIIGFSKQGRLLYENKNDRDLLDNPGKAIQFIYCPMCGQRVLYEGYSDEDFEYDRREFLEEILSSVDYWGQNDLLSKAALDPQEELEYRLSGLAFSILAYLDGCSLAPLAFRLVADDLRDASGELHDLFGEMRKDKKRILKEINERQQRLYEEVMEELRNEKNSKKEDRNRIQHRDLT